MNSPKNDSLEMVIAIDSGFYGLASYCSAPLQPHPRWMVEHLAETLQDRAEQLHQHADAADLSGVFRIAILETPEDYIETPQPDPRVFENYGQLEGILAALQFQIIRVHPQTWQAALNLKSRKGESKADHRAKALTLFPQLKPTLNQADALLILYSYTKNL